MASDVKRGDIVRQRIHPGGRWDYFHVDYVHRNGALDCITDADGKRCGLSWNSGGIEKATLAQLLEHQEQQNLLVIGAGSAINFEPLAGPRAINHQPEGEPMRLKPIPLAVQYACYAIGYQWRAVRGLEQPR